MSNMSCPVKFWTYDLRPHYTNLHSLVTVQNDGIISSVEINATLAFLKKRQYKKASTLKDTNIA
jgi:hypothetical protein